MILGVLGCDRCLKGLWVVVGFGVWVMVGLWLRWVVVEVGRWSWFVVGLWVRCLGRG